VPDISATEIPKPLNWQDFQRSSRVLFRCLLRDDNIQEFGGEGQTQHGIDLFGYRNGDTSLPVGIQCRRIKSSLTEKKMRSDLEEARAIKPALTEFIFATTADRDKDVQLAAARLTTELKESGWDCRVTVMAWPDLQHDIAQHQDALRAFSPTMAVTEAPIIAAVKVSEETVTAKLDEHTALLREMSERQARSASAATDEYDADLAPEARQESAALHGRISEIRKLIGKGKTKTALESLQELERSDLPPYARHRVLANIGAIHFNAGRNAEALDYFRRALALRPDDPKALTNLAYAELISGDVDGARARAAAVLEKHPDHAGAASLVIQSHQKDDGGKDPFALVPKATHDAAEVLIAAIVVLRARNDPSWMELAKSAGERYPKDRHLSRFAAEAVIDPALSDRDVIFGKHVDPAVMDAVTRAAATLRDLWSREMQLEDVRSEEAVPLANNAAAALRFSGDDVGAAQILDETLAKVARDPGLVRARALLYLHADENEKGADLLRSIDDPEGTLFLAQLTAAKEPARAKAALSNLEVEALRPELRAIVPEVWGEIALAENDKGGVEKALKELEEQSAPFETVAILRARAIERGLIDAPKEEDDEEVERLSPIVAHILEELPKHEAKLGFPARVQLAQFLERHNADEAASNLLHGRIDLDRDSVSLRTYLGACIGAQLFARARDVLAALPPSLMEMPTYARMAASYHWNIGDARAAEPFIARLTAATPQRLDFLLWHIDALIRIQAEDRVKTILQAPVETTADGSLADKRKLVAALATYGQLDRARAFAYRLFALNRDDPGAWMSFMGTMLTGDMPEKDPILDPVIGPDHAVELRLETGEARRYVIESDQDVRRVTQDAIAGDHEIARLVQGLKPADTFTWPGDGSTATITGSKHKLLDAFHTAIGRFNDRFPGAKGFKQVRVGTADEFDTTEIEKMLRERASYIEAPAQKYEEGRISLSMLAHLCGLDPVDAAIGLAELGKAYRVSVGSREEREGTIRRIREHKAAGCVVDAATYHCIRRLGIEDAIRAVCGPIGITQATADIYHVRVQSLDYLGGEPKGSMTMRGGKMQVVEYPPEYLAQNRRVIESDRDWLTANAEILPAIPKSDPPLAMRRMSAVPGARFFDDIFAASGSSRLLVSDDLFTRQAGNVLGVVSTSLQPVLMIARERGVLSPKDYARAISELIDMGQKSIGIDAAALMAARELDIDDGVNQVGPRLTKTAKALGGPSCDPASHCSVTAEFIITIWGNEPLRLDDYAVVSHVLSAVLRSRTGDYGGMLQLIDRLLGGNEAARRYLREWARGHFLI
jgi:cellulose synthase operon protein C